MSGTTAADALGPRAAAQQLLAGLDRAQIVAAMWPQQPDGLLAALVDVALERRVQLSVLVADVAGSYGFLSESAVEALRVGRLRVVSLAGAVPRRLAPLVDHVPATLWNVDRMLADGTLAVDVFVGLMHETTRRGELSYGAMVGYSPSALSRASRVGFEVAPARLGPHVPTVAASRADALVKVAAEPPTLGLPEALPGPELLALSRRLAGLIPVGCTLQLGLGAVPNALTAQLSATSDHVLHSGILPAGVAAALAEGRLRRTRRDGRAAVHVATGVMPIAGTAPGWPDSVHLLPVSHTHAADVLRDVPQLWAVNSAFEVDLNGQVNAEYLDGVRVSSAGGQLDFLHGARLSSGGAAVLALPSRSRSGRSRIRPTLMPPTVATTSADSLDYVVTEHGVAALRGLTFEDRREALIAVAHPDDRAALRTHQVTSGSAFAIGK